MANKRQARSAVRNERVPKRLREHGVHENGASATSSAGSARSSLAAAIWSVGGGVGRGAFGDKRTRGLDRRLVAPPSSPRAASSGRRRRDAASTGAAGGDAADRQRVCLWRHLASRLTPCVPRVVEFAKRVPGFEDLSKEDQVILLKVGAFEMWLLHATRFDPTLTFDVGVILTHKQLESRYDVAFASYLLHVVIVLKSLGLNDTEFALFSAAVLFSPERPGISDVKTVQYHQAKIFDVLKYQISLNHNNSKKLEDVLTKLLVELRSVGICHYVLLGWFRVNWRSMNVPPLFAEIFNIPKRDDDLQ